MSDKEIQGWMRMLSPRKDQQCEIIIDLLRNAVRDGMSPEDRAVCKRALELTK